MGEDDRSDWFRAEPGWFRLSESDEWQRCTVEVDDEDLAVLLDEAPRSEARWVDLDTVVSVDALGKVTPTSVTVELLLVGGVSFMLAVGKDFLVAMLDALAVRPGVAEQGGRHTLLVEHDLDAGSDIAAGADAGPNVAELVAGAPEPTSGLESSGEPPAAAHRPPSPYPDEEPEFEGSEDQSEAWGGTEDLDDVHEPETDEELTLRLLELLADDLAELLARTNAATSVAILAPPQPAPTVPSQPKPKPKPPPASVRSAPPRKPKKTKGKHRPIPSSARCPTCGSSSIRRLGAVEKGGMGALVGPLLSKSARSQFGCNDCGYFW